MPISPSLRNARPLISWMRSLLCSPAVAAGEPGITRETMAVLGSASSTCHVIPTRNGAFGGGGSCKTRILRVASVSAVRRRPKGDGPLGLSRIIHYPPNQPHDPLHPGGVDQIRFVGRTVVLIVQPGMEHEHGRVLLKEGVVVGVRPHVPGEVERKRGVVVVLAD